MTSPTQPQTYVYATYIKTTPEKLWKALTEAEFSEKYWFGFRIKVEQKTGGNIRIDAPKGLEWCGDHAGKVLECEPGRKLVYEFVTADTPEVAQKRHGPSRVTYELQPMGDVVRLRLIHENLLAEDTEKDPNTFRGINNGWPAILSALKSLLETGDAIAYDMGKVSHAEAAR
jgi:uncharacterized protein YndB with AHSA1/START domain